MKAPLVMGIAVVSFFIGVAASYVLLHSDYEELHLKEGLTFVDMRSKNEISLPKGTVLVRGGRIPYAPDDTYTAFIPIFVPDKQVDIVHPLTSSTKTYYGIHNSNANK